MFRNTVIMMLMINVISLTLLLMFIAITLMLIGFALLFLESIRRYERGEERVEGGAVIVVGPIPLAFGTSKGIVKTLLILAIALDRKSVV